MSPAVRKGAFSLIALAGLVGVAISMLMTWHHDVQLFGDASLQGGLIGCEASEEVNCDIVKKLRHSARVGGVAGIAGNVVALFQGQQHVLVRTTRRHGDFHTCIREEAGATGANSGPAAND